MSSTRHAAPGSPMRQEKYCSSPEYERGPFGHLVAKRCHKIESPEDAELIWFVQAMLWKFGPQKFAAQLLEKFPGRTGTASMMQFGREGGRFYEADQVKAIRKEIDTPNDRVLEKRFLLRGEQTELEEQQMREPTSEERWNGFYDEEEAERARARVGLRPLGYPAQEFIALCDDAASAGLAGWLMDACLDPELKMDEGGPWYFHQAVEVLRELKAAHAQPHAEEVPLTETGRRFNAICEYALGASRLESMGGGISIHLVLGKAGIGKTMSAKRYCDLRPGLARYVLVPTGNDEKGLLLAIARSLGVPVNLTSKANALRERIEEALIGGRLLLVLDEAQQLWPESYPGDNMAKRIAWVVSLANRGVPIVLLATGLFDVHQEAAVRLGHWDAKVFNSRLLTRTELPSQLPDQDLMRVARYLLPGLGAQLPEYLAIFGSTREVPLRAMVAAVTRAKHLAALEGRLELSEGNVASGIKYASACHAKAPAAKATKSEAAVHPPAAGGALAQKARKACEERADELTLPGALPPDGVSLEVIRAGDLAEPNPAN